MLVMNKLLKKLEQLKLDKKITDIDYYFTKFMQQQTKNKEAVLFSFLLSLELKKGNYSIDLENLKEYLDKLNLLLLQPDLYPKPNVDKLKIFCKKDKILTIKNNFIYFTKYFIYEEKTTNYLQKKSKNIHKIDKEIIVFLENLFVPDFNLFLNLKNNFLTKNPTTSLKQKQEFFKELFDFYSLEKVSTDEISNFFVIKTKAQLQIFYENIDKTFIQNFQKIAAYLALKKDFFCLLGGPGTGKTTTVIKILSCFLKQNINLKIALVAPTGKAAMRLSQGINLGKESLNIAQNILDKIPTKSLTLHALLGLRDSFDEIKFNQFNKLDYDLVLIDESSMISLEMFYYLILALDNKTKLILLGDSAQLPSILPGDILNSFFLKTKQSHGFEIIKDLQNDLKLNFENFITTKSPLSSPIRDNLALLTKSYRFHKNSHIGMLAKSVGQDNWQKAIELLNNKNLKDIDFIDNNFEKLLNFISHHLKDYFSKLKRIKNQDDVKYNLNLYAKFQTLCVLNNGKFGSDNLNIEIENNLIKQKVIKEKKYYHGKPIIILENSFNLGLANGDVGIALKDSDNKIKIYFLNQEVMSFYPYQLPKHKSVFCMTTHKSQGSEFDEVLLIMPKKHTEVSSKELIYTAISRAKKKFYLFATDDVFKKSILNKTNRISNFKNLI